MNDKLNIYEAFAAVKDELRFWTLQGFMELKQEIANMQDQLTSLQLTNLSIVND
jgi:hypothetical protein